MAKPRTTGISIPGVAAGTGALESDIGADDAPPAADVVANATRASVNLTVDGTLKWEFKEWCTRHRMTQVQAFRQAFAMLQERHGR